MTDTTRTPPGVPTGGQFAATPRTGADMDSLGMERPTVVADELQAAKLADQYIQHALASAARTSGAHDSEQAYYMGMTEARIEVASHLLSPHDDTKASLINSSFGSAMLSHTHASVPDTDQSRIELLAAGLLIAGNNPITVDDASRMTDLFANGAATAHRIALTCPHGSRNESFWNGQCSAMAEGMAVFTDPDGDEDGHFDTATRVFGALDDGERDPENLKAIAANAT